MRLTEYLKGERPEVFDEEDDLQLLHGANQERARGRITRMGHSGSVYQPVAA